MPVRGSGIGASMAAGGLGLTSTRSGSAAGTYAQLSGNSPARARTHTFLMVLVVLEIAALLYLRHAFRHHHGG